MELGTQRKAKHYNYWLGIVSESSLRFMGIDIYKQIWSNLLNVFENDSIIIYFLYISTIQQSHVPRWESPIPKSRLSNLQIRNTSVSILLLPYLDANVQNIFNSGRAKYSPHNPFVFSPQSLFRCTSGFRVLAARPPRGCVGRSARGVTPSLRPWCVSAPGVRWRYCGFSIFCGEKTTCISLQLHPKLHYTKY